MNFVGGVFKSLITVKMYKSQNGWFPAGQTWMDVKGCCQAPEPRPCPFLFYFIYFLFFLHLPAFVWFWACQAPQKCNKSSGGKIILTDSWAFHPFGAWALIKAACLFSFSIFISKFHFFVLEFLFPNEKCLKAKYIDRMAITFCSPSFLSVGVPHHW